MPSVLIRILLFLSSYFPLSFMYLLILYSSDRIASIVIFSLGTLGLIGIQFYFSAVEKMNAIEVKISSVKSKDGEAMSYLVTYLLPFISISTEKITVVLSMVTFFLVLGALYINSNMIHINPMLNILGYHIYEIEVDASGVCSLITKRRIKRGDLVMAFNAGDNIYIEVINGKK